MDVSKNRGTLKSSTLIGFCIINHPFWGTTIFGNTHMDGWIPTLQPVGMDFTTLVMARSMKKDLPER